jgi:hypothetical protein
VEQLVTSDGRFPPPSRAACFAPLVPPQQKRRHRVRRGYEIRTPKNSRVRGGKTLAKVLAGMSVQDAFRTLWDGLACSRQLVERADEDAGLVATSTPSSCSRTWYPDRRRGR